MRFFEDERAYKAFLSTPPSRVATFVDDCAGCALKVSIHATLAGGDSWKAGGLFSIQVSIHATLAGGDGTARPA